MILEEKESKLKSAIKKKVKAVVKKVLSGKKDQKDYTKGTRKGVELINSLGLEKIQHIWIQKILNTPGLIYIITFDSRYPRRYFPVSKLRKLKSFKTKRLKVVKGGFIPKYNYTQFKMSAPVDLHDFDNQLRTGAVIIVNDIAGEFFLNKKMYENFNREEDYIVLSLE